MFFVQNNLGFQEILQIEAIATKSCKIKFSYLECVNNRFYILSFSFGWEVYSKTIIMSKHNQHKQQLLIIINK